MGLLLEGLQLMVDDVHGFRTEARLAAERRERRAERPALGWPQAVVLVVFFVSLAAMVWAIAWAVH